jgi:FemAB-related protein (PEP-CTERM system-associated)
MHTAATLDETPSSPATAIAVVTAADGDQADWQRYASSRPDATGYHDWRWRRVFKTAFGHDSIYLMARDRGQIVGILPIVHVKSAIFGASLTSMAFLNYGGIVADSDEAAVALRDGARQVAERVGCGHVELRHIGRRFDDMPCRQHKVTMHLPLSEGMWEKLDRKVRTQIRKAQKSGLTVERGGAELAGDFYQVFRRNMRDLGTPVYTSRLFEAVLAEFPDRTAIHVVRQGTNAVASALTFATGSGVEVPWASSIRDFNALCPNHLMYWDIIEHAVERGLQRLDFGRSTPHEGTYKFKEQWGAQPVPLHWEYVTVGQATVPDIAAGNPKYRLMVDLWKRLPLGVATWLGPPIVRGIP